MRLRINDRVTWSCLAGQLTGTVVDVVLDLNAADKVVPWIDIKTDRTTVRLCATDMNLKMRRQHERLEILRGKCIRWVADCGTYPRWSGLAFWSCYE